MTAGQPAQVNHERLSDDRGACDARASRGCAACAVESGAGRCTAGRVSRASGCSSASLLFYYPLVFLGRALVDYDAFVYFYPQRVFLAQSLLAGHIPLWDPYLFLGVPFLANPQTAVLYPPSWLFVLGPVAGVYAVQLVLHAFLAAFFTYLLARHAFGVLPLAAAVGGLAYAFGGFAVGQVGHLNQISAAAWLPAVLLAYDRFAATRRMYWVALGALALALQLLAGHPQETYMTLIVLGIFGAVRAPWRSPTRPGVVRLGGVGLCLLGAALAAAQLLPTLELTPLSIRGAGRQLAGRRGGLAAVVPGRARAVAAVLDPVSNTEYLGYVGVTPIALGLLAVMLGRSRPVLFGALIAVLGLFLALGENNGLYQLVVHDGARLRHVPRASALAAAVGVRRRRPGRAGRRLDRPRVARVSATAAAVAARAGAGLHPGRRAGLAARRGRAIRPAPDAVRVRRDRRGDAGGRRSAAPGPTRCWRSACWSG